MTENGEKNRHWGLPWRFGFDIGGAVLFALLMLPNILWFFVPAQNDILRQPTKTEGLDTAVMVLRGLAVGFLIFLRHTMKPAKLRWQIFGILALALCAMYWGAWGLYYLGVVRPWILYSMCWMPGCSIIFYGFGRKNYPAQLFALAFLICHCISVAINFG